MIAKDLHYVSCGIEAIYGANGSFPEPHLIAEARLADNAAAYGIVKVREVFAPTTYGVPFSPVIFAQESDSTRRMAEFYPGLAIKAANAAVLVTIDRPCTFGSVILRDGPTRSIVYETFRPNDRPAVSLPPESATAEAPPVEEGFFLGSAGSFNYGHFLVDDLPRIKALEMLDPGLAIVMASYGAAIDRVRTEAIRAIAGEREIVLLDRQRIYRFRRLFYVTPVSVHPTHKHPLALDWMVRAAFDAAGVIQAAPANKLLVVRRSRADGRALVNQVAIENLARRLGHEIVHAEDHGFLDQVRLFSQTLVAAGQMGAAMTNAVFCSKHTRVLHLAPEGWTEPFYWDLAMTRQQDYRVLFGEALSGADVPMHQRDFRIDPDALVALLC